MIAPFSASDRFAGFVSGKSASCPATDLRTSSASFRDVVTSSAMASGSCSACANRSAAMYSAFPLAATTSNSVGPASMSMAQSPLTSRLAAVT